MGENSKIEWTDHTLNFWMGCTAVSPACDHCYAEALMDHRHHRVEWGAGRDRVRTKLSTWNEAYKWDRAAAAAGRPALVFSLSLGDIWDNEVDPMWRSDAFELMEATPNLIYLLLSKRIGNAEKMCDPMRGNPMLPKNAALGATVINQDEWDRDVPKLKKAGRDLGSLFTFTSVEPMLGEIRFDQGTGPDWVICGGESGPHARPMHPYWAQRLQKQCARDRIPFLMKQWGEWAPWHIFDDDIMRGADWSGRDTNYRVHVSIDGKAHGNPSLPGDYTMYRVGKQRAGRELNATTYTEFPAVTRRAS